MTTDEAISELGYMLDYHLRTNGHHNVTKADEALTMAIEALQGHRSIDYEHDTLCGKPIKEVIQLLNGLELEHIYNLEMTMDNLSAWKDLYDKEQAKVILKAINQIRMV